MKRREEEEPYKKKQVNLNQKNLILGTAHLRNSTASSTSSSNTAIENLQQIQHQNAFKGIENTHNLKKATTSSQEKKFEKDKSSTKLSQPNKQKINFGLAGHPPLYSNFKENQESIKISEAYSRNENTQKLVVAISLDQNNTRIPENKKNLNAFAQIRKYENSEKENNLMKKSTVQSTKAQQKLQRSQYYSQNSQDIQQILSTQFQSSKDSEQLKIESKKEEKEEGFPFSTLYYKKPNIAKNSFQNENDEAENENISSSHIDDLMLIQAQISKQAQSDLQYKQSQTLSKESLQTYLAKVKVNMEKQAQKYLENNTKCHKKQQHMMNNRFTSKRQSTEGRTLSDHKIHRKNSQVITTIQPYFINTTTNITSQAESELQKFKNGSNNIQQNQHSKLNAKSTSTSKMKEIYHINLFQNSLPKDEKHKLNSSKSQNKVAINSPKFGNKTMNQIEESFTSQVQVQQIKITQQRQSSRNIIPHTVDINSMNVSSHNRLHDLNNGLLNNQRSRKSIERPVSYFQNEEVNKVVFVKDQKNAHVKSVIDEKREIDNKALEAVVTLCISPQQFKKSLHYNQPKIMRKERNQVLRVLMHVVKFMNVDSLIKIAQTSKKFSKSREVKFIINSQLKVLVIKGLSTLDRIKYWNYRTRFVYYKKKYRDLYQKIIREKKSDYQSDISKDLDRTFPQLKHFTKGQLGQDQLERVLTAISIYYKKLGYVQGMNFIVGTILLNFHNEEDAYWMMISILVNFKLDSLLTFENQKFKLICYQIDMFVKAYLPQIYDGFKENELSSEFYASHWLFTFFSIDLSFDIVFIVMDLFLLEGFSAFIRVQELGELSYDESLVYLKSFGKNLDTDVENFYEIAMSFKISKSMCKDLEKIFYECKNPHDVQFDYVKQQWIAPNEINIAQQTTNDDDNPLLLRKQSALILSDDQRISLLTSQQSNRHQQLQSPQSLTRLKFNPINSFGNKVKTIFKWFKKDNKNPSGTNKFDDLSNSSHRSADIEDAIQPMDNILITPQSQQVKTFKENERTKMSRSLERGPFEANILNDSSDHKTQLPHKEDVGKVTKSYQINDRISEIVQKDKQCKSQSSTDVNSRSIKNRKLQINKDPIKNKQ